MRVFTVLLVSLISSNAAAEIHTCEINQRTVYSDTPCSHISKNYTSAKAAHPTSHWWEDIDGRNQYKQPVVLDGPLDERVDKVASIISEAWLKSNDCQTAISTGQEGYNCKDFLQYIEPDTAFWQASRQYQSLNFYTKKKVKNQQKMTSIEQQIHDLVSFRAELKQYVKKQQPAQR
ncbi:hypothetical protein [Alkalimarinus alittae]|uniref:DUF4124 domain-containing protein n=1 Tax=Alkalimarinus alittae TaxID=2961619 RepID=A0ABY6N5Y5_9ALTE|nr:hypothetical protein [Alkalimarinus alittae]UZE97399.1 hypothetical protein NKI27_06520 [Alkalimarinus alittae]